MSTENEPTPEIVNVAAITSTEMPKATAPIPPTEKTANPDSQTAETPKSAGLPIGEKDSAGVLFDPRIHLTKRHPKTGRWIPKGGRRPKTETTAETATGMGENGNPPPAASYIPGTPPPPDEADSPGAGASGPPPPASEAVPIDADPVGSPEDTAETAAAAVYLVTGLVTGEMGEATPSAAEHRGVVRVLGAYFRARGWKTVGIYAVGAALTAYLIRLARKPKHAEKIKRWRESWERKADPLVTAKTVKSVPMPIPTPTAPADAAPFTTSATHDPFSGSHL